MTDHYTILKISVTMARLFHQHTKLLVFPTVTILLHSLSLDHVTNYFIWHYLGLFRP